MSFTGTPIYEQISETELRITGLRLAANTPGTLAFPGVTLTPAPDFILPNTFQLPQLVSFDGSPVSPEAFVQVLIIPKTADGVTNLPPSVNKTGSTAKDFLITITNTKVDLITQEMEIYIRFIKPVVDSSISVVINATNVSINQIG